MTGFIAYLSADFATTPGVPDHELFELHDRRASSLRLFVRYGDYGVIRPRLETGVDRFIDIRNMNDSTAATMISDLEIDIAVDLKGFTRGERAGILAYRPAPIQVNYLGYPGTMGADFIDYIIADSIVIPMEDDRYYSERVVRLPDCYQVNDSKRLIADRTPTRAEVGLPEHAFVYCCFNGNFKITPTIFDVWMRILRRVDRSVLWLFQGSASAEQNLRREAGCGNRGQTPRVCGEDPVRPAPRSAPPRRSFPRHVALQRAYDRQRCSMGRTSRLDV
jgi:predicted O-linked N-acetylglucosamine transferase (SPINDLY family)